MGFRYRHSEPQNMIYVDAVLEGKSTSIQEIVQTGDEFVEEQTA